uniref:Uncharacterized protein n=1 Tax=Anguilla anguilla TaxID=7936 RepID=A0A0E9QL67_ANGAN
MGSVTVCTFGLVMDCLANVTQRVIHLKPLT